MSELPDLLNLPGLKVMGVTETESQYTVLVEAEAASPEICCIFQGISLRRNGSKRQMFRNLPIHGKYTDIQIDRQRYHCKECGKTVYDRVPHIDSAHRMTERMAANVAQMAVKKTFAEVARDVGLSEGTIKNVFRAYVDDRLKGLELVTPRVLGIDEKFLLGNPRAVIGNVEQRTLMDILPTRYRSDIGAYLDRMTDRDRIEVVCQDMYHEYRTIARRYLPKAAIVVDKFHVVKKANEAVEKFRRTLNATLPTAERLKLKNQRKILLARNHTIQDGTREKLEYWFAQSPALEDVYWLKERFYDIYLAADASEAEKRYERWLLMTEEKPQFQPFFRDLLSAMANWKRDIFTYFEHPFTNAYVEGVNRLLDDLQRAGRGYTFDVIRAKALLAYGHQRAETKKFYREKYANHYVDGRLNLPKDFYGANIDSLIRELNTKTTAYGWRDGRYVKIELSAISTLNVHWGDLPEAA